MFFYISCIDRCRNERGGGLLQASISNPFQGIARRDDLALLRNLDAAGNRGRRLCQNTAVQRHAAASQGSAPPMEILHLDAKFVGNRGDFLKRYLKLPVGRNGSAILVAVRVAEHDLLQVIHCAYGFAVDRKAKELTHDLRRSVKVLDRLEQRCCLQGGNYRTVRISS